MALPAIALPGQLLGHASKYTPGPGTHIHASHIYASLAGRVSSSSPPNPSASKPTKTATSSTTTTTTNPTPTLPTLTVAHTPAPSPPGILGPSSGAGAPILPSLSSPIYARITRLGPRFASAEILVVDSTPVITPLLAQIRREDIRATEKDKVVVSESFRVGDVVRGEVIGLGDVGSGYFLGTAGNGFGVVLAWGEGDAEGEVDGGVGVAEGAELGGRRLLEPVSWCEMRDPRTGRRERRKVAKPF